MQAVASSLLKSKQAKLKAGWSLEICVKKILDGETTNPIYVNSMYKIRSNDKTIIFEHRESNYPLKSCWYSGAKMV